MLSYFFFIFFRLFYVHVPYPCAMLTLTFIKTHTHHLVDCNLVEKILVFRKMYPMSVFILASLEMDVFYTQQLYHSRRYINKPTNATLLTKKQQLEILYHRYSTNNNGEPSPHDGIDSTRRPESSKCVELCVVARVDSGKMDMNTPRAELLLLLLCNALTIHTHTHSL